MLEINQVQHFYLLPCVRGDPPSTHWHEVLSRNTGDTKLSYGENTKVSVSPGFGSLPGRDR